MSATTIRKKIKKANKKTFEKFYIFREKNIIAI